MADFLLEILSEEIPARMQQRAVQSLHEETKKFLLEQSINEFSSEFYVTPRRLILALSGLPERQEDVSEERKGPKVGAPDKAVEGFARGAGVAVADLEECETDKGPCWLAVIHRKGRSMADLLAEAVPAAMAALPWPKSMRWGDHDVRWVRPINAILAVLDGAVVPFRFGPIVSGNSTRGHRFLAPDWFEVRGFEDYREKLRAAHVLIDADERRRIIREGAEALAASAGLTLDDQPRLLDEVAGLVEWPVPMMGGFDPAFMEIPHEVIVTEMTQHQRYFPLRDGNGALAPHFVFAANTMGGEDGAIVRAGNERVLTARLSDGRHFWDQDRKRTLESRVPDLEKVVFHAKLGTVAERVSRMERLAASLAASIPGCDLILAGRAAHLAKADLTSEMVGEFPELQGVMGAYYARHDGEVDAVAQAIAEHYSPQGPSDICPAAPVSVAVALAEKIDTLTGFFAIDEKPTGSRDPFALRRAALGVIRLILENGLRLELRGVLGASVRHHPDIDFSTIVDPVCDSLMTFFADRLKVHLREEGVPHDLVDAIFGQGADDDLVRLMARVRALQAFLAAEDGANLLSAYRRAANIVRIEEKKDGIVFEGAVDESRLEQDEERAVVAALKKADETAGPALDEECFEDAMTALAALRAPVDAFFDRVTVNAEAPALRHNRLNLLAAIRATLDRVADFSKIEG
jgi:glycyl-tRNA synthetase beta chain